MRRTEQIKNPDAWKTPTHSCRPCADTRQLTAGRRLTPSAKMMREMRDAVARTEKMGA